MRRQLAGRSVGRITTDLETGVGDADMDAGARQPHVRATDEVDGKVPSPRREDRLRAAGKQGRAGEGRRRVERGSAEVVGEAESASAGVPLEDPVDGDSIPALPDLGAVFHPSLRVVLVHLKADLATMVEGDAAQAGPSPTWASRFAVAATATTKRDGRR